MADYVRRPKAAPGATTAGNGLMLPTLSRIRRVVWWRWLKRRGGCNVAERAGARVRERGVAMRMRYVLPVLLIGSLPFTAPPFADARGGMMSGRGGGFGHHGGFSHGGAFGFGDGGGFGFAPHSAVILPTHPSAPIVAVPRPPNFRSQNRFPGVGPGYFPLDDGATAPTVEINLPPQVVVVPDAGAVADPPPVPAPPTSPPARRNAPGPGPKIVLPPAPDAPASPCAHTVTIYRGSAVEVQSFPISPCPSPATSSQAPTSSTSSKATTSSSSKAAVKKALPSS